MARGKTPSGDDKFNLRVIQDGTRISTEHFQEWKKDEDGKNICIHHNGCPEPVQKRGGKWDFSEQNDFLCDYMEKFFADHEPPVDTGIRPDAQEEDDDPPDYDEQENAAEEDDDDIPF